MKLKSPRIRPLERSEWNEEAAKLLEGPRRVGTTKGETVNILATLARYPTLFRAWSAFGNHVLFASSLPPRERELLILRIGWLCGSEYEFGQHAIIGRQVGLTDDEVRRVTLGPDAPGWEAFDATLLRAVDELHADAFVSDATWNALAKRYDERQLMDLLFAVGQYNLVSMVLNSLGVQLDPGVDGFPR